MHEAQAQVGKTNIDRLMKTLQEAAEKKIGTWYIVHSSTFIRAACSSSLILRQSTGIML